MDLYALRHAIAVDRESPDYVHNDSKRPLTRKGRRRMRREAQGMARLGLKFDLILSSPYVRARETSARLRAAGKSQLVDRRPMNIASIESALRKHSLDPVIGLTLALSCLVTVLLNLPYYLQYKSHVGGAFALAITGSLVAAFSFFRAAIHTSSSFVIGLVDHQLAGQQVQRESQCSACTRQYRTRMLYWPASSLAA